MSLYSPVEMLFGVWGYVISLLIVGIFCYWVGKNHSQKSEKVNQDGEN